jgi:hypothetical protein
MRSVSGAGVRTRARPNAVRKGCPGVEAQPRNFAWSERSEDNPLARTSLIIKGLRGIRTARLTVLPSSWKGLVTKW